MITAVPAERLKDVEQARKKLLAHAPAVPSPLRKKISSRTILASRLAATSLNTPADSCNPTQAEQHPFAATSTDKIGSSADGAGRDDNNDNDDVDDALLESYRARVKAVLSTQRSAVLA